MQITRNGAVPARQAPSSYFTGSARFESSFKGTAPATISGLTVAFDPGARTHWHTHPLGQTLYILSGQGWVQRDGGPVETINPGDIVHFEPGERHWHGGTDTTAMCHLAFAEALDGVTVTWLEPVTDSDYGTRPRT